MKKVNDEELKKVEGGGFSWGIAAGIIAAVTFIIGVIEGYTNPSKCNN